MFHSDRVEMNMDSSHWNLPTDDLSAKNAEQRQLCQWSHAYVSQQVFLHLEVGSYQRQMAPIGYLLGTQ